MLETAESISQPCGVANTLNLQNPHTIAYAICGFGLSVLYSALRVFPSASLAFPSHQKPTNLTWFSLIRSSPISRAFELGLINVRVFLSGEDEDVMVVDEPAPSRKRKAEETQPEEEMKETPNSNKAKRAKISNAAEQIEDDVIVLWELITDDLVRTQFCSQVFSS